MTKSKPKPKTKPAAAEPTASPVVIPKFKMTEAIAGVPVIHRESQSFQTGMKYAWGLIKVDVGVTTEPPPGNPWATWDLPIVQIPIYVVVEVSIIGRTLIAGFVKII